MDYRNQICKQNNHEERIKELEEKLIQKDNEGEPLEQNRSIYRGGLVGGTLLIVSTFSENLSFLKVMAFVSGTWLLFFAAIDFMELERFRNNE